MSEVLTPTPEAGASRDMSGADLSGQHLSGADLRGHSLLNANLSGAHLERADLRDADLSGANLDGAILDEVDARNASFGHASLKETRLFSARLEGATFSSADARGADFRCADLQRARMQGARLGGADFSSAMMRGADLVRADLDRAVFTRADLSGTELLDVTGFRTAGWIGVDLRDVNFAGAYRLRRHVMDENYLHEFRESGRLNRALYTVWWLTSDCGRSIWRWCALIAFLTFLYAALFSMVDIHYGAHDGSWLTRIYFSVVTLTTLGYGDVTPSSAAAKLVVMAEVVTGYVMLGGLLSIFSNKIARRGE